MRWQDPIRYEKRLTHTPVGSSSHTGPHRGLFFRLVYSPANKFIQARIAFPIHSRIVASINQFFGVNRMVNRTSSSQQVVIYGPHGCGKSTHATRLAAHYGKTRIVDGWTPGAPLSSETLALTNVPHKNAIPYWIAAKAAGIQLSGAVVQRIKAADGALGGL